MRENGSRAVNFWVKAPTAAILEKLSAELGISQSAVVNMAVHEFDRERTENAARAAAEYAAAEYAAQEF